MPSVFRTELILSFLDSLFLIMSFKYSKDDYLSSSNCSCAMCVLRESFFSFSFLSSSVSCSTFSLSFLCSSLNLEREILNCSTSSLCLTDSLNSIKFSILWITLKNSALLPNISFMLLFLNSSSTDVNDSINFRII